MKKTILALVLTIFMLPSVPAVAEIYKYIDADGQKRWTDDLSQVPKEQRPTVQRVETSEDGSMPASSTAEEKGAARSESPPASGAAVSDQPVPEALSRDALEKEKADLDEQYRQLMEERKKLVELKAKEHQGSSREELNQRVAAYNKKAEAYDKRLDQFNNNVDQYNRRNSAATKAEAGQ